MNYYTILNTPVTEYPSGRRIGAVSDIYIKENSTEIIGIVAKNRSLIYQNRLFKKGDILYTGTDEVSVRGPGIKFLKEPKEPGIISFKKLIGLKASSFDNNFYIGTVKDGFFDMEQGTLTELLMGRGIADDLLNGRKILRADSYKTENGVLKAKNPALISKSRFIFALPSKKQ
mgnify:FL=1